MNTAASIKSLQINCQQVTENAGTLIAESVKGQNAEGVLLGLSGGIDSAVLATLAKQALGTERIRTYHLHDRTTMPSSIRNAQLVADHLKINLMTHDIDPEMRKQRIYNSFIMKIVSFSETTTSRLSRGLWGEENPFVYTLRRGDFDGNRVRKLLYKTLVEPVANAFYARHIYRRQFLEKIARQQNRIVLGAANRSEVMVGRFVKNGIDDMFYSPVSDLYKTQIYQLAEFLGVPDEIINQSASPDMLRGVTDECAIGITYKTLDMILYGIDNALSDGQLIQAGITQEQIDYVRKLHLLSAWKRSAAEN